MITSVVQLVLPAALAALHVYWPPSSTAKRWMSNRVLFTSLVIFSLKPSGISSMPFLLHVISDGGWLSIMASKNTSPPCSAILPCGADTNLGATCLRTVFEMFRSTSELWEFSLTSPRLFCDCIARSKNEVWCWYSGGGSCNDTFEELRSVTCWLFCPSTLWYSSVRSDSD